ncbi:Metallo-dependent phosphatase [Lentithecium fluviatile CBS 122367]|uniref:Metallo-dependent phosphatase n=1 Tax=Lentithecium fluviatile CBS 122367 TaxID=1168545 RepID=A0A6G1IIP9_9PLEO|nr:Metallo-dependent phosphatase [Lentithecium fluviatile CBS 122367]
MKREAFLWLLTATAGATPLVGYNQGTDFDYPGLRFDFDRKFRITMFNDLHLGDGARPGTDDKTIGVMNKVLDAESGTDLVVLNGDLTSCEWISPEAVNSVLDKIIDPLMGRKKPFTATFGNHDMSQTCDTRRMGEHIWDKANAGGRQMTWTTSSVKGDYNDVGTSNYYLPVYSMGGGGNPELKMVLWFFDSKGGRQYQPGGADVPVSDWVDQKVVSWFKLTRDQMQADNGGKPLPSLAFVHIPPSVTVAFQQSGQRKPSTEPGLNEELIGAQANSVPDADGPFMQALVETEGLMAVFSGHDHGIDWCMKYSATRAIPKANPATGNNMHLCFGRHTGYGGYSDWMRGGRHIVVDEDALGLNVLETWVRLEDGSVSGRVTLNSSYSEDVYPLVGKKKSSAFGVGGGAGTNEASTLATTTTTMMTTTTTTSLPTEMIYSKHNSTTSSSGQTQTTDISKTQTTDTSKPTTWTKQTPPMLKPTPSATPTQTPRMSPLPTKPTTSKSAPKIAARI